MDAISSPIWTTPSLPVSASSQKRALIVPDDLVIALNGAISLMTKESAWRNDGGESVEDTLQRVMEMWLSMGSHCYELGTLIPNVLADVPSWAVVCDGAFHSFDDYPDMEGLLPSQLVVGNTFQSPDLEERFPYVTNDSDFYGLNGGQSAQTLTVGNLPSHNHSYNARGGFANVITPGPEPFLEMNPLPTPASTGNTGSGNPFSIIPPLTVIGYMMVVKY